MRKQYNTQFLPTLKGGVSLRGVMNVINRGANLKGRTL